MPGTTDFPKALREWRTARGLTQKKLAELLGITRMAICNYELGKSSISFDVATALSALGFNADIIPQGRRKAHAYNEPFTDEERQFAELHHGCVYKYLTTNKLPYDDWYDVVVFGYLRAVKKWFARPDLHIYSFLTIAYNAMRASVGNEFAKARRRPKTVSIYDIIPGTEDFTYGDTLCDPRDCVGI